MIDEVTIDSVDVTATRISWRTEDNWDSAISSLSLRVGKDVEDLVTLRTGLSIVIERQLDNALIIPAWGVYTGVENAFNGIITQVIPQAEFITIIAKGKLIDAIKSSRTKSWDKDIDTEGGVGSEIFKDICDNSGISYSATSIVSTGTAAPALIVKFIQNDESDFEKMNDLAKRYNYTINYNNWSDVVEFKPKGYSVYSHPLVVGVDIPGQLKWKENMEQLINKVKILGATVYDKVEETFAGPATSFTLSKTPEDTEVRDTDAVGAVYTRGQKDVGTIGTDFDYYVDVEQKQIVFSGATANVWIRYGTQVPMPVIVSDTVSIATYGGPNNLPHFKTFVFNNLKDIKDAEDKGRAILNKYATPFTEIEDVPIVEEVYESYGFIKPGMLITITDAYNNKVNQSLFVQTIEKSWPHVYDKLLVGDELWRMEDWQVTQMEKINLLFSELNKNQDILVTALDLNKDVRYERRYAEILKKDRSGAGTELFILGHPTFGVLGTQELGDISADPWVTISLIQKDNIFKEYISDNTFYASGYSSGVTWDTSAQKITVTAGGDVEIGPITLGPVFNAWKLAFGTITGTYTIYLSLNGRKSFFSSTIEDAWTSITNLLGINYDGTGIWLRIYATTEVTIEPVTDTDGEYTAPAIQLNFDFYSDYNT